MTEESLFPEQKPKPFESIDEALRAFIDKQDREKGSKVDNDWWWASDLGRCMRRHYLRRRGINPPDKKEYRIKFIGKDGQASHEWKQAALKDMGILIESEGRLIDPELKYKGRFDALVQLKNLCVVDFKSQRPEAFWKRRKDPLKNKIKNFQKVQLGSYFIFLRRKYPELKEARLYFWDRAGGSREEYVFKFSEKFLDSILNELKSLNDYWNRNELPPASNDKDDCKWCEWKSFCKELKKKEKENENNVQKLGN